MTRLNQPESLTAEAIQAVLPKRDANAHKGLSGSIAVIGGADGMVGAALLAARAALLSGAGRVYAALLANDAPRLDVNFLELMLRTPESLMQLPQLDALVLGPGLGHSDVAVEILAFWLEQDRPLLLDADALNLIAAHTHLYAFVQKRTAATVITPHVGEAARLLSLDTQFIQEQRQLSALQLAKRLNAVCLLKGPATLIAHADNRMFVNPTGNAGLASGGTGDVLSGLIGGLMVQGLSAMDAAKAAVYIHGAAADKLVARGIGPLGLTASEVTHEARDVLNQLNATAEHS